MVKEEQRTIWGGPTKRFFVSMLTRDIQLADALLDLIDNSVDGATRQIKGKIDKTDAYEGFSTELTLSSKSFDIADNCGGIPEGAIEDAFLLGRPKIDKDKNLPTIGMYGIGMKRAIFKIGKEAIVESYSDEGARAVTYTSEWLDPENESWDLPIETIKNRAKKGVTIAIPTLRAEIARQFGNEQFQNELRNRIAEHFGYLMQKGFVIRVNGQQVPQRTLQLYTTDTTKRGAGIRPYDFESDEDGVNTRVTVGFYRPLSSVEEVDEATERPLGAEQAGISVICNDRVVLENDTGMKTGWGDGGVPKYHPQFRGIAGFIIFSTNTPEKLPISTTKRDLDAGADLFLRARQACMEGLRECTSFTNKWKGMEVEANALFEEAHRKDARTDIRLAAKHGAPVRGRPSARKLLAALPAPETRDPSRRISFIRKEIEIRKVSEYLFNEDNQKPAVVGQECFDRMFKQSKKS